MSDPDRETRWTGTFERLPEEKRSRVLDAAKRAFAAQGFLGANINRIADDAGISVGSMYKYFRTKEDLFLAIIEEYHAFIAASIDAILARESGFARRVEALIRASVESSVADPEAVRLYIACTTDELADLASRVSLSLEEVSAVRYRSMVAEAQAKGEVDPGLDPGWAAFFLDDILLMTQYSVGSDYYRARLEVFLGASASSLSVPPAGAGLPAPDELVERLHELVMRALAPRS